MAMTKADWAANLIMDSSKEFLVKVYSADNVVVSEMDGETLVAHTVVTEPMLLRAMLSKAIKIRSKTKPHEPWCESHVPYIATCNCRDIKE